MRKSDPHRSDHLEKREPPLFNPRLLQLKIFFSRAALFWEKLWQGLFWPVMVIGLFLLGLFSGVFALVSYGVRLGIVAVAGLAFLYSLKNLRHLRWPDLAAGLARLEKSSNVLHRPLTAWHDRLAGVWHEGRKEGSGHKETQSGHTGDLTGTLWQAHKQAQQREFEKLKPALPRSGWIRLDHNGLRFTLAMLVLVAFVLGGQDWRGQLASLVSDQPVVTKPLRVAMDAWISPPAFTGKAPVLLTSAAQKQAIANGEGIVAPEGSILKVRINGVDKAKVVLSKQAIVREPGDVLATYDLVASDGEQVVEKQLRLSRPVHVTVTFLDKTQANWDISLIPDAAPQVMLKRQVSLTPTGGFAVDWLASDDYGIASLHGELSLVTPSHKQLKAQKSGQEKTVKPPLKREGPLVFEKPNLPVSLPRLNPKTAKGRVFRDLTAHPWAGQKVSLVLIGKDQAGQVGRSAPLVFVLPTRHFSKPLARALVEQRARLVAAPRQKTGVLKTMAALMAWPDGLFKKSGHYVSMRLLAHELYRAKTRPQLKKLVGKFWQLAVHIEEGGLSAAKQALEAARKALQKALAEGASKEQIAKLTQDLKKALNDYMAQMQRQMRQAQGQNQSSPNGLQQQGKEIRARDLQKLMEKIENLAKSGANDAAQEMLSQLENILKNLNPQLTQRPMAPQRTPPEAKMLDQLTKMMRKQRELMDKTFKMPREKLDPLLPRRKQKNGNNGQQQFSRPGSKMGNKLGTQQERLKNLLGKMMRQMQDGGLRTPRELRQAQKQMDRAAKALKNGQRGPALGMQGNALQGLRKGAEAMAKDLMARGKGEEGNFGRHGETRASKNDPLGRPMPRDGADLGPREDILPKEREIMRAQDIMRALRSRSNDRQRPRYELEYLQRLLDGLF